MELEKTWRKKDKYDWLLDFRRKMKCPDNHWDGVFSEHTIEHLHPADCLHLFKELFRTMKPGAWMRICVPGLQEAIQLAETNKYSSLAEAIYHLTQNYGHVSVWDEKLFKEICKNIGFINVNQISFMQGSNKKLLKDSPHRSQTSLYMEAQKPTT